MRVPLVCGVPAEVRAELARRLSVVESSDARCVAHAGKCCLCERLSSPVLDEDDDGTVLAIAFDRPWALVGAALCETDTRRPSKRRETEHATKDVTMAERRRRASHVAARRSKTTCGAVSRNCRMARSPVGACTALVRNSHCSLLLHNDEKKTCNRTRSQPRGYNGASGAERERSARQRGAANETGRFFKPFLRVSLFACNLRLYAECEQVRPKPA